jgi:hypothetical protein
MMQMMRQSTSTGTRRMVWTGMAGRLILLKGQMEQELIGKAMNCQKTSMESMKPNINPIHARKVVQAKNGGTAGKSIDIFF